MSFSSKLKARKADFVDLVFCLDRPLLRELEEARSEARQGAYSGGKSDRVKELEQQVKDASVTIRIESLGWRRYNEIVDEHPARDGVDEQFNSSTFFEAIARETAKEVTEDGIREISDEDWEALVDGLTDGEYDRLAGAVVQLNRNVANVGTAPLV